MPVSADVIYGEKEELLCEIFHENSNITLYKEGQLVAKISQILGYKALHNLLTKSYKTYSTAPQLPLPPFADLVPGTLSIEQAILQRRSIRNYTGECVSLDQLSKLLFFSYGITGEQNLSEDVIQKLRAVPSGGGLYPLEVYIIALRVEGIEQGIYHYNVQHHSLEQLKFGDFTEELVPIVMGAIPEMVRSGSVLFVISGFFRRMTIKYGDRGYRYALFEVGELSEHLQLVGTSMNLGTCQIAGYYDDEMNKLLGIDGVHEAVLNLCIVGKTK